MKGKTSMHESGQTNYPMDNLNLGQNLFQMITFIVQLMMNLKRCLSMNSLDVTKRYSKRYERIVKTNINSVTDIMDMNSVV